MVTAAPHANGPTGAALPGHSDPPEPFARRRVLHVVSSLGLGGTEKVMQLLLTRLDPARFQRAVWSPADGPRAAPLREAGVTTFIGGDLGSVAARFLPHIVHVHRAGWPQPELLRPLRTAFRQAPAAARSPGAGADARLLPTGADAPRRLPAIVETNVFGRHDPSLSGQLIDVTLFVSRFCAERFARVHGIAAEPPRWRVLYNPVDTALFARLTPPPADRDYTRPVLGRLSRPDPGKWSPLALHILPVLRREMPHFRYDVVGGTPDAERYVREHGLTDNVRFLPPLHDDAELAGFFNQLSLLAHANDTGESFGLAIAEAMAAGLPVVTHPCPGLRDNAQLELVEHGVTGLVAETADDYAGAVLHLLRHPGTARRMGEAGRRKAAALFDADMQARALETLYDEVCPPEVTNGEAP
ncbi:glycosyltransferase family 4 protein [Nitratidesulfovibrio sp.]|uniref:glycosyltransferase family 4 protein n=1 Tax=Nitratidesulfovibrio sp. TaxID=2802297 RepID=UPI003340FD98